MLGGAALLRALAALGVFLDPKDGERLLRACSSAQLGGSGSSSSGADVHYSDFLRFVAKHAQQPQPPGCRGLAHGDGDSNGKGGDEASNSTSGGGALQALRDRLREALRRDHQSGHQRSGSPPEGDPGGALPSVAALRRLFHRFDRNGDGYLAFQVSAPPSHTQVLFYTLRVVLFCLHISFSSFLHFHRQLSYSLTPPPSPCVSNGYIY